ncbi:ABC transporter permease [Paramicrobacterium fandaimingii]|uniref:ABC transporter permease n=1 Tax=Paramicrobacterium fandaimingii TaxID=2708079 RepID=UPI0014242057|nr:ABC transporter permease [Microbacterium fandaimingii]
MSLTTEMNTSPPGRPRLWGPRSASRRRIWRHVSNKRVFIVLAIAVLGIAVAWALFPSLFSPGSPLELRPEQALDGPSAENPLGTDQFGRSLLAQIIYGSRSALMIGILSVVGAFVLGGLIGLLAGFLGGAVDTILMRIIDVLLCFPGILLALVIAAALGPTLQNLIIAIAIGQTPDFARVMRGQVLSIRSRLFIEAVTASGVKPARIVFRHILPNALAPVTVIAALGVGSAIVSGATLSFLGLGPQGGVPDWGRLLSVGQDYLATAWWISTFPGLVITVVVIAVNILGDALRDKMDVES